MAVYKLEMRNTENWKDVRYRAYTTSAKKASAFRCIPRIDFSDSAHGLVPVVREKRPDEAREPLIDALKEHVDRNLKNYWAR